MITTYMLRKAAKKNPEGLRRLARYVNYRYADTDPIGLVAQGLICLLRVRKPRE